MNFQDLGATGIIAIVIIAFAAIGFLKGVVRTVSAMVCLGIAGYAALWGNEHASDLTGPWIENPGPWLPKIIAVVTGLVVFFICRYILKFIVDPFNRSETGKRIGFGLPAAVLSLCSGLAILWVAFAGIRYGGALAELRYTRHRILNAESEDASTYAAPLLLKAMHSLDASSVGKWHQRTDPFHEPGKLTLCKVLVMYHHLQTRDILLKDPTMRQLFNHSAFLELAYQESIKNHATIGKPRELYMAPPIAEAITKAELRELIEEIDPTYLASVSGSSAQ